MSEVMNKYDLWLANATEDEALIEELKSIRDNEEEIFDRFYTELEFGTAGLRGVIGAGDNRMNIYTVGKATQGLADYIKSKKPGGSVAISYDSRINSILFAKRAAGVLAANGIKVYISPVLEPTPVLSFMVRHYGCDAGIMITASHNPAKYNGYKCYGPDGCQMTDDDANATTEFIRKVDTFAGIKHIDFEKALSDGIIEYTDDAMLEEYYKCVLSCQINPGICAQSGINILFSPLNGTGNIPVREILGRIGVKVGVVSEQELPDGNFPTTPFPNPEFSQVFDCAREIAKTEKPDLILATDPDCDRVGIAVRNEKGEYELMTGNEVGCMLLYYILECRSAAGTLPEGAIAVKSIVTSDLAGKVAQHFGCRMVNILTGFKYIGEQIKLLEKDSRENLYQLGFEESYGYLSKGYVRDKDAVNASMLIVEMAAYCKKNGMTLLDYMQKIYSQFGVYKHKIISASFDGEKGMLKMKDIMSSLRNSPPAAIAGLEVVRICDYLTGADIDVLSGKQETINLPRANVYSMFLEGDCSVIIRPSGTEPKIKAYLNACAPSFDKANEIISELQKYTDVIFG